MREAPTTHKGHSQPSAKTSHTRCGVVDILRETLAILCPVIAG
jgi:hypothetical protein